MKYAVIYVSVVEENSVSLGTFDNFNDSVNCATDQLIESLGMFSEGSSEYNEIRNGYREQLLTKQHASYYGEDVDWYDIIEIDN